MKRNKPNFIFFFCDELRTDALSCYSNLKTIETPNIDRIANDGNLFENCYCNSPVCVPSRTSIMTGLYPEDTGVYNNEAAWDPFMCEEYETITSVLEENGYVTANFGKTHLANGIKGFQYDNQEGGEMTLGLDGMNEIEDKITPRGKFRSIIGGVYPKGKYYHPNKVVDNALDWLHSYNNNKPYFLRISFLQPHTPIIVDRYFSSVYDKEDFPSELKIYQEVSEFEKIFSEIIELDTLTEDEIQKMYMYYYGMVKWIDSQIGRVLDYLDRNNLYEDTVLIFGADHGANRGENGWLAKQIFAKNSHKVPLLLKYPHDKKKGQRISDIVSNIDIAKTVFSLAHIEEIPNQFKGHSLISEEKRDKYIYSTVGFGEKTSHAFPNKLYGKWHDEKGWPRRSCIRNNRYRLDMNIRQDGEYVYLDDEKSDLFFTDCIKYPEENVNLINDPQYTKIINEMKEMLIKHIADSKEVEFDVLNEVNKTISYRKEERKKQ